MHLEKRQRRQEDVEMVLRDATIQARYQNPVTFFRNLTNAHAK